MDKKNKNKGKWFIKHKFLVLGILVFFVFIIPLFVINVLFKWNSHIWFLEAEWSAGEALNYIVSFEAFFGTVLLGAVAIYQNNLAQDNNQKILKLQEETQAFQMKDKAAPFDLSFLITDEKNSYYVTLDRDLKYTVTNTDFLHLSLLCKSIDRKKSNIFVMMFEIENISNVIIKEIKIEDVVIYGISSNASNIPVEEQHPSTYEYSEVFSKDTIKYVLKPNDKVKVCLHIEMEAIDLSIECFCIRFNLSTVSIYNVVFSELVSFNRNCYINEHDTMFERIEDIKFSIK